MSHTRVPRKPNPDGTFTQRIRRKNGRIQEFHTRVLARRGDQERGAPDYEAELAAREAEIAELRRQLAEKADAPEEPVEAADDDPPADSMPETLDD